VTTIVLYSLRESLRRRVFGVVVLLTVAFLALYGLGVNHAFDQVGKLDAGKQVDETIVTGSVLLGLAMFTTLFLGAVLAVFLTHGAVRGDAERGLLQPLVVRPIGRTSLLGGRFAAAALVCAVYVAIVYSAAVVLTGLAGGWWPDRLITPGLGLAAGVIAIAALSLLGSVFLSATANGIAIFMVFGAGLAAGLLGQIGDALSIDTLENVAKAVAWVLPFEALYQAGLEGLTTDTTGATRFLVQLGPFGGAQAGGALLWPWTLVWLALVGAATRTAFARRDL
jgi:ABC-type transport system involved in multi-copper enzyme maturation permease subunit